MSLSGPDEFFNEATYTVSNVPDGCTVEWSSIYIAAVTFTPLTSNGSKVKCTVNYLAGDIYFDVVAKVMHNGTVVKELSLPVHAGLYVTDIEKFLYADVDLLRVHTTTNQVVPGVSVEWKGNKVYGTNKTVTFADNPYASEASFVHNPQYYTMPVVPQTGDYEVWVRLKVNGSIVSDWFSKVINLSEGNGEPGYPLPGLTVSPNPATDVVNIALSAPIKEDGVGIASAKLAAQASPVSCEFDVQLWNESAIVRRATAAGNTCQLSVAGLPKGLYYVVVQQGGETYRQKLVVK